MIQILWDCLLDAVKDTLLLVPFLLATYILMEWLEHKTSDATLRSVQRAGAAGPAVGAVLGVVPQCGFSSAAATLYSGRVVTLGTLVAVFLSTSDEMLPIFLAEQVPARVIIGVLALKIVVGLVVGFAIDLVMRRLHKEPGELHIHELCEDANCFCEERCEGADPHEHEHEHHEEADCHHEHGAGSILLSACKHTLQVALFVFLVSLALNVVLALVGEEALAEVMQANDLLAVLVSATVGLIPNCAASVAIAQLYVDGMLSLGACMAGLLPAAGVGLLVLFRTNKRHMAENFAIVGGLWAVGVIAGLLL